MQIYKKLSEYAKENSVTYRTAWNRFNKGKIKGAFMDDTGHVLIPLFPELKKEDNRVVIYARVSNNDRKKELDYQLNRLRDFSISNGYIIVDEVKEIASGMNDSRPKLINLLTKNSNWDLIIVENKDRLTRFGFNYIETLLGLIGKKIIIINKVNEDKQDLLNDLISIFYSFSARMYGLRKKKTKKDIINFIEKE
jgi:predicted site-specific integrase-resolvase